MEKLTVTELQRLLDDESEFREYTSKQKQSISTAFAQSIGKDTANSEAVLMELKAGNCTQAKANLAMEDQAKQLQSELRDIQKSLSQEQEAYRQLWQTYQSNTKKYSRERLIERLKGACSAAETESERTADNFLNGKSTLDEFCRAYREGRMLFHIRQTKLARLIQQ